MVLILLSWNSARVHYNSCSLAASLVELKVVFFPTNVSVQHRDTSSKDVPALGFTSILARVADPVHFMANEGGVNVSGTFALCQSSLDGLRFSAVIRFGVILGFGFIFGFSLVSARLQRISIAVVKAIIR